MLGAPQSILRLNTSSGHGAPVPMVLTPHPRTNDLSYSAAQSSGRKSTSGGLPICSSFYAVYPTGPSKARQPSFQSVSFLHSYLSDSPNIHPVLVPEPWAFSQSPHFLHSVLICLLNISRMFCPLHPYWHCPSPVLLRSSTLPIDTVFLLISLPTSLPRGPSLTEQTE